jgi:hypothetical protein
LALLPRMLREWHSNQQLITAFPTNFLAKTKKWNGNGFTISCPDIRIWVYASHSRHLLQEQKVSHQRIFLSSSTFMSPCLKRYSSLHIVYISGIQQGVRLPPGVREDILEGTYNTFVPLLIFIWPAIIYLLFNSLILHFLI